ncbi:MAG: hypothetical protein AAB620_00330 [Patescibacteria group bacterium]
MNNRTKAVSYPLVSHSILLIFCFVAAFLLCWHFFQVISYNQKEILIKDCQQKISELSENNKSLEIRFLADGFSKKVDALAREMNFERTDRIHYISVLDSAVAANK